MPNDARYAAELNTGSGGSNAPQQDAVKVQAVHTAGGLTLTLAVVADGDGGQAAGEMARQAVDQLFAAVAASRQPDPGRVLERAFAAAAESLRAAAVDPGSRVSLAAAALNGARLYSLSCGTARVYLVSHDKKAQLLTADNESFLLPGRGQQPVAPRPADRSLRSGDSVVICSDGITQPRAPGQPAFVTDEEIAHWVWGHTPLKAARYLLSEALGRNAQDNLAVAVLQLPLSSLAALARRPALLGLAAAIILLVTAGGAWAFIAASEPPAPTSTPPPTPIHDEGVLIVHDGVLGFEYAGEVPLGADNGQVGRGVRLQPATTLTAAGGPAALGLETASLDAARVYLETSARLGIIQASPAGGKHAAVTWLDLQQGMLLIMHRASSRTFWIETRAGMLEMTAPNSAATVEVVPAGQGVLVACLEVACRWRPAGSEAWRTLAGGEAYVFDDAGGAQPAQPPAAQHLEEVCRCTDLPGRPPPTVTATAEPVATSTAEPTAGVMATPEWPEDVIAIGIVASNRATNINLRLGAGVEHASDGTVSVGSEIQILAEERPLEPAADTGRRHTWYRVRVPDERIGYLRDDVVSIIRFIPR